MSSYNIGFGYQDGAIDPEDYPVVKEIIFLDRTYGYSCINDFDQLLEVLREGDHLFCISLKFLIENGGSGDIPSIIEQKKIKAIFLEDGISLDPEREDWDEQSANFRSAWQKLQKKASKN